MNTEGNGKIEQDDFFIVFSDDWGEHPSSCQHLFKIIGKEYRVLWVNTIGMRNMKLSWQDFKKAYRKVKKMLFGGGGSGRKNIVVPEKMTVIQPFMLPFVRNKFARKFNQLSVISAVSRKAAKISTNKPVTVATVPNACDYVGRLNEKKIIYYCVDDFSLWPGLDKDFVLQLEEGLIAKADFFLATSMKLYTRLADTGKPTTILTHGVDIEHFSNLPNQEHQILASIPKPRVGYFGLFDGRSDQKLICEVARATPNVSFVITGNVEVGIEELQKIPNIYFTGSVSYNELPSVVSGWEACFLAYKVDESTEAIFPLKLKEYLATGKPVIATPILEVLRENSRLKVSEKSLDWRYFVMQAVSNAKIEVETKGVKKYILQESWDQKKEDFLTFLSAEM